MVSVVLPVKGIREHSRHNWSSLLSAPHSHTFLEFIFVLDSNSDPAYDVLSSLIDEGLSTGGEKEDPNQGGGGRGLRVKICLAGHSTTCGQKVHK